MINREALFKEHYLQFKELVGKRKHKWRATSIMEWEDLESILLVRILRQLHLYDPARPLDRWANKVISHAIRNMLRDKVYKDARPCVSGQAPGFNMGSSYGRGCKCVLADGGCSLTKSGQQDSSCKFYAAWEAKKKNKHAISTPFSLDAFEGLAPKICATHSGFDSFVDYEGAKKVIDESIKHRLTKEEYRVYVLLYIKNVSVDEAAARMGFKKTHKEDMKGYMRVRSAGQRAIEVVKQIIAEKNLAR